MSLYGDYDPDNIFARILRDDIPSVVVWEDEHVRAFMDVFPQSEGHVLVISKTSRARNILDVEAEVWALFSPCECWRSSRLRILTKQEIADLPLCLMMRTLLSGGGQGRPE